MSTSISIEKLVSIDKLENSNNYHLWKFKVQLVLEERDLFGVVDGSESNSDNEEVKAAEWLKKDKKARVTICLALSDSVLTMVRDSQTAKQVWDKLSSVFENKNLVNRLLMKRRFLTIRMNEGEKVQTHLNLVKSMSEQLIAIGVQVSQEDLIMTLLMSLPTSYEHLITALDSVKSDELTFDYVSAKIISYDMRRQSNQFNSTDESAFPVMSNGTNRPNYQHNPKPFNQHNSNSIQCLLQTVRAHY
jgi:hypothetical protein